MVDPDYLLITYRLPTDYLLMTQDVMVDPDYLLITY